MITLSIDVDKIDRRRFETRKGIRYLDLVLIETPNSKYDSDYLVKQGVTKEEREKRVQMPILGNARIWANKSGGKTQVKKEEDEW